MYTVSTFLFLLCQKTQIAIVINKYKIVHTGANIHSGGLKLVLINEEYQGSLYETVASPPIKEAEYVIIINRKKDKNLFFNIIIYISFDYDG